MNRQKFKNFELASRAAILFLMVIVTPKLPLVGLEGANTLLRTDTIVSIVFSLVCFYWILFNNLARKLGVTIIFIMYLGVAGDGITVFSIISAAYSILFYISLIVSIYIGYYANEIKIFGKSISNFVYMSLIANSIIAVISKVTGYTYCINVSYGQTEDGRCIIDEYGIAGAPYIFGAYAILLTIIAIEKRSRKNMAFGGGSILLSDSRAFAAAFLPLIFNLIRKIKIGGIKYFIIAFAIIAIPFVDNKITNGFGREQLLDASFEMRLRIYEDYIQWLDVVKFIIGEGTNAFLKFAIQYDLPGHPDNLYIRLLSEIGVVGVIFMIGISISIMRELGFSSRNKNAMLFILGLCVLSLAQESLFAVKSGHVLAYAFGYVLKTSQIKKQKNYE